MIRLILAMSGTLGGLLVCARLAQAILWPWWVVTLPFWWPIAIFAAVGAVVGAGFGVIATFAWAIDTGGRRR